MSDPHAWKTYGIYSDLSRELSGAVMLCLTPGGEVVAVTSVISCFDVHSAEFDRLEGSFTVYEVEDVVGMIVHDREVYDLMLGVLGRRPEPTPETAVECYEHYRNAKDKLDMIMLLKRQGLKTRDAIIKTLGTPANVN